MKDQVTTIEQSQRLVALGVSARKASMVWIRSHRGHDLHTNDSVVDPRDGTPAFTVADLLGVMPWEIEVENRVLPTLPGIRLDDSESTPFRFKMRKLGSMWTCRYASYGIGKINGLFEESRAGVNLIDPLCELIEWLVSNGYKLEV